MMASKQRVGHHSHPQERALFIDAPSMLVSALQTSRDLN